MNGRHVPVLAEEVELGLAPERLDRSAVFVDATAGLGGHAVRIGARLARGSLVVLCDLDAELLPRAREAVRRATDAAGRGVRIECVQGSYAGLPARLAERGAPADLVLADLGFASCQMEDPERGLSFASEGPLDMRLDRGRGATAGELLAELSEGEIERILREYGEEPRARRIARKLVEARGEGPIRTTSRLAELVREAGAPGGRIHPATRTFQALRIAVNDELGHLDGLLCAIREGATSPEGEGGSPAWLAARARIGIISFHSLEDRRVKRAFGGLVAEGRARRIGGWPVKPGAEEVARNPRSRSARLRMIELL